MPRGGAAAFWELLDVDKFDPEPPAAGPTG
jgi:hypothetical protein